MIPPDEAALVDDLAEPMFEAGATRGWWRLARRTGTTLVVKVTARGGRSTGIRVDCAGYPTTAPTAQLWDVEVDQPMPLDRWPAGGRASEVFSPGWSPANGGALYWPLDRQALIGHESWRTQNPGHVWTSSWTISQWLQALRDVLRSATTPAQTSEVTT